MRRGAQVWGWALSLGLLLRMAAPAAEDIAAAEKLLTDKATAKEGVRQLRHLLHDRDPAIAIRALVAVAPQLRAKGAKLELDKLVEPYSRVAPELFVWPQIEGFCEAMRQVALGNDLARAIASLSRAEEQVVPGLPQVVVAEAFADCLIPARQFEKARGYYTQAQTQGDAFFVRKPISPGASVLEPAKPGTEDWPRIRARLQLKLAWLNRELLAEKFGWDYATYATARQEQAKQRWAVALALYDELIDQAPTSIYTEAARFYRCFCVEDGKDVKATIQLLAKYSRANAQGLYCGEALYSVGHLALVRTWDVYAAADCFGEAIAWCQAARRAERAVTLYTIPAKSREVCLPPPESQELDSKWMVHDVPIPPEKLVNQLTAKWYLNDLEKKARYGLVFCQMARRQWDGARNTLGPVLDLDDCLLRAEKSRRPNTYFRLKLACELHRFVSDAVELRQVPAEFCLRLQYAEMLYLEQKFDDAWTVLGEVVGKAQADKEEDALAVAMVDRGEISYMKGDLAAAQGCFEEVVTKYPREKVAARAHFYLGNLIAAAGRDRAQLQEALGHYEEALKRHPGSAIAENAQAFSIPLYLRLGQAKDAQDEAKKLLAAYPKDGWEPVVNSWFSTTTLTQGTSP